MARDPGEEQKMVFKMPCLNGDPYMQKKVLEDAARVIGVSSVAVDVDKNTLTATGRMDAYDMTKKMRRFQATKLVSVGPSKEAKPAGDMIVVVLVQPPQPRGPPPPSYPYLTYPVQYRAEEDPTW